MKTLFLILCLALSGAALGGTLPEGTTIQQVAQMPGAYTYRDGRWHTMPDELKVTPASQAWHEGRTGARLSDEERTRARISARIRAMEAERRAEAFERERNATMGWRSDSFQSRRR